MTHEELKNAIKEGNKTAKDLKKFKDLKEFISK